MGGWWCPDVLGIDHAPGPLCFDGYHRATPWGGQGEPDRFGSRLNEERLCEAKRGRERDGEKVVFGRWATKARGWT